ncbi:MAG TPA: hypothetical protein VF430_03170 [Verrucomicrobiae bacterium]
MKWTRSRPLARPSRASGFAKFLSPTPKRLKSCLKQFGLFLDFFQQCPVGILQDLKPVIAKPRAKFVRTQDEGAPNAAPRKTCALEADDRAAFSRWSFKLTLKTALCHVARSMHEVAVSERMRLESQSKDRRSVHRRR